MTDSQNIPYGYCHCGCGEKTRIAPRTRGYCGHIKGEPMRYIRGHHLNGGPGKTTEERFWEKVDKRGPVDCWEWTGGKVRGYGTFSEGGSEGTRWVRAYRYAFELLVGPTPGGLHLDHLCRNPSCVNPDHLEPVTPAENAARTGRVFCKRGHPIDGRWGDQRYCKECNREAARRSNARRRNRGTLD